MPADSTYPPAPSRARSPAAASAPWNELLGRLDRERLPACAAAHWDADPDSLEWVGSGSNVVYRFESAGAGRYLKIIHADLRSPEEVCATLELQEHLASRGAPVCRPLRARSGRLLEELTPGEERFVASVHEEVAGTLIQSRTAKAPEWLALGRAIGALHRVAASFPKTSARGYGHWRGEWRQAGGWLDLDDAVAQREYAQLSSWLESLRPEASNLTLTHGDLNLGNLLWAKGQISVIDFDEPVWHFAAADVVRPMRDLLELPRETRRGILAALVRGYRCEWPLGERWISQLPSFLRLKDLEIYAWLESRERWSSSNVPLGSRSQVCAEIRARMQAPLEW